MRKLPEQEPGPDPGQVEGLQEGEGLALELPLEAVGKKQPPEPPEKRPGRPANINITIRCMC